MLSRVVCSISKVLQNSGTSQLPGIGSKRSLNDVPFVHRAYLTSKRGLKVLKRLSENFGNPEKDSQLYMATIKYLNSPVATKESMTDFTDKLKLIRQNLSDEDILYNDHVLTLPYSKLDCGFKIFNEFGIQIIQAALLNNLHHIVKKPCNELIECGYLSEKQSPLESILNAVSNSDLLDEKQMSRLRFYMNTEFFNKSNDWQSRTLESIRNEALKNIFRAQLDVSEDVANHIVKNIQKFDHPNNISIQRLIEIVKILTKDIQLPASELVKNFSRFMNLNLNNIVELGQIPEFQESNTLLKAFFARQKLLSLDVFSVQEKLKLLQSTYGCSLEELANYVNIFEFSEKEINEAFEFFQKTDIFNTIQDSPDRLRIINNIEYVKKNYETIKEKNIPIRYVTPFKLAFQPEHFRVIINKQKFNQTLNSFVDMHFKTSVSDIKNRIGPFNIPRKGLNIINAEEVINFCREQQLTDQQILNAILLVYFDFNSVKRTWKEFFERPEIKKANLDWRRNPMVLQAIFYLLNKEFRLH